MIFVRWCRIVNCVTDINNKNCPLFSLISLRPLEKIGTDIFDLNGKTYLMTVEYYSRYPVLRFLNDMTTNTMCNHFTSMVAEYGLHFSTVADFGSQYNGEKLRSNCEKSGIAFSFSHQITIRQTILQKEQLKPLRLSWKKLLKVKNHDTQLYSCIYRPNR